MLSFDRWDKEGYFPVFDSSINNFYQHVQDINSIAKLSGKHVTLEAVDGVDIEKFVNQETRFLITNSYIKPGILSDEIYKKIPDSWYGMYSGPEIKDVHTPDKNFNCFINRLDPIRQSWFYLLIRENLLDQGYVSFNMSIARHNVQIQETSDGFPITLLTQHDSNTSPLDIFELHFRAQHAIFESEHQYAKKIIPYRNFDSASSLIDITLRSKFSIVLETSHHDNRLITFSEKTFRCLRIPRLWILFSTQGAVAYLRKLGFDVLDDIVDHGYDIIESEFDRQTQLLSLAQKLCNIEFTDQLRSRCQQAAAHNHELLLNLYKTFDSDTKIFLNQIKF